MTGLLVATAVVTAPAAAALDFGPATIYAAGGPSFSVAVGDLNGDGRPDLTTVNDSLAGTVSVLLGNGDGTFNPATTYPTGGGRARSVAVGDLNGDSKPDLTTATSSGTVSVLLGNGDGTFSPPASYPTGSFPVSGALGDVNGDNKLDFITANGSANSVSVLLGNGDSTFNPAATYPIGTGTRPNSVVVGDLNGDNKPDLTTANFNGTSVSVLLGNGDGTFNPPASYPTGGSSVSVVVGDLNGDNKPDLTTANQGNNNVSVLLGNGDGTFNPAASYPTDGTGTSPRAVAVGDLNGDNKPDLTTANGNLNSVSVLLGNGDGTFSPATAYPTNGSIAASVVVRDFNGDGRPDLATANQGSSNVSVLLAKPEPAVTTTAVSSVPDPSAAGEPVVFTASVTGGSTTPTGAVTFTDTTTGTALCTGVALTPAGTATCTTAALAVGAHMVGAEYSGDDTHAASSGQDAHTVVPARADIAVGLTARATSGLLSGTVAYTLTATNNGPQAAADADFTLTYPAPFTYQATSNTSRMNCDPATSRTLTCHLNQLVPSGGTTSATITLTTRVPLLTIGTFTATATRTTSTPTDPNTTNNTATTTCRVGTSYDIRCN
ncbi:FG-GAP repeat domain-containing protein [Streptomyces vinaceus]